MPVYEKSKTEAADQPLDTTLPVTSTGQASAWSEQHKPRPRYLSLVQSPEMD